MEKNRKSSSGNSSCLIYFMLLVYCLWSFMVTDNDRYMVLTGSRESSGRRMKEVACPTCTVHLQVRSFDTRLSLYDFGTHIF